MMCRYHSSMLQTKLQCLEGVLSCWVCHFSISCIKFRYPEAWEKGWRGERTPWWVYGMILGTSWDLWHCFLLSSLLQLECVMSLSFYVEGLILHSVQSGTNSLKQWSMGWKKLLSGCPPLGVLSQLQKWETHRCFYTGPICLPSCLGMSPYRLDCVPGWIPNPCTYGCDFIWKSARSDKVTSIALISHPLHHVRCPSSAFSCSTSLLFLQLEIFEAAFLLHQSPHPTPAPLVSHPPIIHYGLL